MTLDPLILSRLQFFWVIGWHILLPAFTIGLASFIAVMEAIPPPGTIICTWGWCVSADPQVWSTAVMPIRAPRWR